MWKPGKDGPGGHRTLAEHALLWWDGDNMRKRVVLRTTAPVRTTERTGRWAQVTGQMHCPPEVALQPNSNRWEPALRNVLSSVFCFRGFAQEGTTTFISSFFIGGGNLDATLLLWPDSCDLMLLLPSQFTWTCFCHFPREILQSHSALSWNRAMKHDKPALRTEMRIKTWLFSATTTQKQKRGSKAVLRSLVQLWCETVSSEFQIWSQFVFHFFHLLPQSLSLGRVAHPAVFQHPLSTKQACSLCSSAGSQLWESWEKSMFDSLKGYPVLGSN